MTAVDWSDIDLRTPSAELTSTSLVVPELHWQRLSSVVRALEYGLDEGAPRFRLERKRDHSGVSGTGRVAECVELPGGLGLLWWTVPGKPPTCTVSGSIRDLADIHGHHGDTQLEPFHDRTEA